MPTTLARADYTVQAGDQHEPFFSTVRDALVDSQLGPWTSQVEWGLGQWEINLAYQQALEMADRHILFKLAMRDLAAAHGMAATFMAKPFPDTTGSSCHLHLSLLDDAGANVFGDGSSGETLAAPAARRGRRRARAGPRPDALVRAHGELLPAHRGRGVLGQRPQLGLRQPHGVVSRARGVTRVDPARVARAGRRREPLPRDRGPARFGARRHRRAAPTPASRSSATTGNARCRPCPRTSARPSRAFADSEWAAETFGAEVVAHYAEAGRWEWERFLAADVVTEWERARYFEVI